MKTYIIVLLLCLTSKALSQDDAIDSIKLWVDTHEERDSIRVNYLIELTKYYSTRDDIKTLDIINEALDISEEVKYPRGKAWALSVLSKYYVVKGDLDKALQVALEAKKIVDSVGFKEDLILVNNGLARIYNVNGNYEESLKMHLENVDLVKDNAASADKAGMYFYVAKTLESLGKYIEAKDFYLKALEVSKEANFQTGVAIAEGSLGVVYNAIEDYNQAIIYLKKTLAFAEEYNQDTNVAASCFGLTTSYEGLGQYNLAIRYNSRAIQTYENTKNFRLLKDAYISQSRLFEKTGDLNKALDFFKKHTAIKDSLYTTNKLETIEELRTQYETEKKEAEIASLSQKSAIQALEIKQKNQALIIGIIAFLFVLAAIYFLYQQRETKKQQSQTELEQRFLRSQLNPHFISNALVAVQSFMLKNDAKSATLYLTKFSKLMREILENSRREFITVEEEISMLENYMDIHQKRLGSFEYTIELDESIDPEMDTIPPMFVQPFVENAVEHGIGNIHEGGKIKLKFEKDGDFIRIVVSDNGKGLSSGTGKDRQSLSTTIIQERMNLFNKTLKKKIQLVIDNLKNEKGEVCGTKVELKVPFSYI